MLEGLEVSEILYSKIHDENRYDSEFFKKKFMAAEIFLNKIATFQIAEEYVVTDGEHGSVIIRDNGVKYLTAENIKRGYIDISNVRYVDATVDKKNARARVQSGDILISIKGTLGEVAVAQEWLLPANMNRDVAILKPLSSYSLPEFVTIFLMSKYGALQSFRGGSGGVQQMITLERLRKFKIPRLSHICSLAIAKLYKQCQILLSDSKKMYIQAEVLLLDALRLTYFHDSVSPINIKSFKNSFGQTGRLDAEYYQPKYDDYQNSIFNYTHGWGLLGEICELLDKNFSPIDNDSYRYIELSDIDKSGSINSCTSEIGKNLPSRARRRVCRDDVLISSIEGSLASCAIVSEDFDQALCSTGFYIIKSNKINSETLLVLFKSEIMQNILKQNCSGTILTAINKTEFLNIPIPIIDKKNQSQIANLIKESFTLKAESERLLELAKRAVEVAIERDEDTAMKLLQTETNQKICKELV